MVELVYTRHLKCLGETHVGSNPISPTNGSPAALNFRPLDPDLIRSLPAAVLQKTGLTMYRQFLQRPTHSGPYI